MYLSIPTFVEDPWEVVKIRCEEFILLDKCLYSSGETRVLLKKSVSKSFLEKSFLEKSQ